MYCPKTYFVSDEPSDFITMMMQSYVFDLYYFRLSRDLRQNGRVLAVPDAAIAAESRIASEDIQFLQPSLAEPSRAWP